MIEEWKEKMNKNEKEREEEKKGKRRKKCRKIEERLRKKVLLFNWILCRFLVWKHWGDKGEQTF